ncbi:SAM-dependent methyltransferase [Rhodoblastus sphagnicola]|nr:N-6 DNA methylase [Rhodoblastus sphagnicola]MBB4197354.1 SAM-dependent methyltransferase [Rhodoblastus sphagnicola]
MPSPPTRREAILARSSLAPDPTTIRIELGRESVAFCRAREELARLWRRARLDPALALKRRLWAELLKLVHGREIEGDDLWLQHSYLVIVAKCIALALIRMPEDDPRRLLSGEALAAAGINGAVESDFFDWVTADEAGIALARRIMAHVRRFRLAEVESDVLKILYESLVDRDERHGLGEYYTPDWLAAKVVRHAVDRPLEQRVLDPACGSGAFLFHAVRNFLREADESGMAPARRAKAVCNHVAGIDIHPVAVIIARVTYLLALAPALAAREGGLSIPVSLGDAMQPSIGAFMAGRELTLGAPPPCGWAHVLVGNPPWVAFRHMSADLQKRFKDMARGEGVYVGGKLATQNDLCALFTARAATLYLRPAGRIAFVLPMAVLTRGQFAPLRSGSFHAAKIQWDEAWTMDESVQPLFPVPACVLFGRRCAIAKAPPDRLRAYSGSLPLRDASEEVADARLTVRENAPALDVANFVGGSVYRAHFFNGATLFPRMLCLVEREGLRLGADASALVVVSRRNAQEKQPWKDLADVENKVEAEFLRPVLLGESILPFRLFQTFAGVIPVTQTGELLDAEGAANRGYAGLHGWMRKAETLWRDNQTAAHSFLQQIDYYGKLASQFPVAPLRVVYAKAGNRPAAMMVKDAAAVVDHKLYWSAVARESEALYLCAILNSETARARIEAFQSRGRFGARDFDKVMFNLPIPRFDGKDRLHLALAGTAARAEEIAAGVVLPEGVKFQRARALIRAGLTEAGVAEKIDALVARLLDGG